MSRVKMLSGLRGDRGAITAEFAIALPAVLLVLGLAVGAIMLATHRLTLTSAAADVVRLEARGDASAASARLSELGRGVEVSRETLGPLLCITLSESPGSGLLSAIRIQARSCAAVTQDADW